MRTCCRTRDTDGERVDASLEQLSTAPLPVSSRRGAEAASRAGSELAAPPAAVCGVSSPPPQTHSVRVRGGQAVIPSSLHRATWTSYSLPSRGPQGGFLRGQVLEKRQDDPHEDLGSTGLGEKGSSSFSGLWKLLLLAVFPRVPEPHPSTHNH